MFSELIEQSASSETGYDILPRLSLDPIENESSNITSLCFSAPQGLLAAGFESGLITMYDIQSGSLLNSFQSDAAGINQVKFDRKGNLVSVGNSTSQLKVWDLRSLTSIASRKYSESDYNLTALCPHSVNDTIYCGTSSGSVLCWDLRSHDDFIIQNTLHSEPVSSLILHPSIRGSIISASYDGAVISTDFNNTNSSQMNTDGSMNEHYESYACTILMQDYAPVTCLDVHSGTRSLLAGTATGDYILLLTILFLFILIDLIILFHLFILGAIWLKSFERNAGSVSN